MYRILNIYNQIRLRSLREKIAALERDMEAMPVFKKPIEDKYTRTYWIDRLNNLKIKENKLVKSLEGRS